jgi:hypothetical protein
MRKLAIEKFLLITFVSMITVMFLTVCFLKATHRLYRQPAPEEFILVFPDGEIVDTANCMEVTA